MSLMTAEVKLVSSTSKNPYFDNSYYFHGYPIEYAPLTGTIQLAPTGPKVEEQLRIVAWSKNDVAAITACFRNALQSYPEDQIVYRFAPSGQGSLELGTLDFKTNLYLFQVLALNSPHILTSSICFYHPHELS